MTKLAKALRVFGRRQNARHILPLLAMEVARAAQRGEVSADNAIEVYIDYYMVASGGRKIDPYDAGIQANASKLRQIIKAKSPGLLSRVTAAHQKLSARGDARPLYHAMVACCRAQLARGKELSDAQVATNTRRRK
jgi:hypothetical protein